MKYFTPIWTKRVRPRRVAIGMAAIVLAASSAAAERPNVLVILIDDHAALMTSVLAESGVRTPNIERLAARGTWFTRAYNAVPTCAASRTALLTGVAASRL